MALQNSEADAKIAETDTRNTANVAEGVRAILNEKRNAQVLSSFWFYAVIIAILPISVFFLLRKALNLLPMSDTMSGRSLTSDVFAGVGAALCVQILTCVYAYKALSETPDDPSKEKQS